MPRLIIKVLFQCLLHFFPFAFYYLTIDTRKGTGSFHPPRLVAGDPAQTPRVPSGAAEEAFPKGSHSCSAKHTRSQSSGGETAASTSGWILCRGITNMLILQRQEVGCCRDTSTPPVLWGASPNSASTVKKNIVWPFFNWESHFCVIDVGQRSATSPDARGRRADGAIRAAALAKHTGTWQKTESLKSPPAARPSAADRPVCASQRQNLRRILRASSSSHALNCSGY